MGDQVTCRAVLEKHDGYADSIFLAVPPDWKLRILPCRPKGKLASGERPEWEYEERGGKLHVTPSLLCTDTKFHTDGVWSCDYELRPEGIGSFEHLQKINPTLTIP